MRRLPFSLLPGSSENDTLVTKGVVDISLLEEKIVPLTGEWACFEDAEGPLPTDSFAHLPAYWNHPDGFASYRMKATGLDPDISYALWVPAVETSCRVFGNGMNIFSAGSPGRNKTQTMSAYVSGVASLPPGISDIELVLEVANFGHRQGGPSDILMLGPMDQILRYDSWNIAGDSAVIIMFIVLGVVYVFNAFVRRKTSSLFIGLIYVFGSLDVFLSSPQFLVYRVFPLLDFGVYKKFQYLASFLRAPSLILGAWSLFGSISLRSLMLSIGPFFLGMIFIVVAPYTLFTHTCSFFQVYSMLLVIGTLFICLRGAKKGYPFSGILVLAFLLMAGMALSEIMYMNNKIQGGQYFAFSFVAALIHLDYIGRTILDIFSSISMVLMVSAMSLVFLFEEKKMSLSAKTSGLVIDWPHNDRIQRIREKCQERNLSPREIDVLLLALQGKSNIQIGEDLCISVSTVKSHFSKIFQKTETKTRGELFAYFWA